MKVSYNTNVQSTRTVDRKSFIIAFVSSQTVGRNSLLTILRSKPREREAEMSNCIHNQHVTGKTLQMLRSTNRYITFILIGRSNISILFSITAFSFLKVSYTVSVKISQLANQQIWYVRIVLEPYERSWRDKIALRVCVRAYVREAWWWRRWRRTVGRNSETADIRLKI